MAVREFLFTSESVTEGHPDKVADQISDTVLDAVLTGDPGGRVACETLITTGLVVVAGSVVFAAGPTLLDSAEQGDRATALRLLSKGASPNVAGPDGTTPIM